MCNGVGCANYVEADEMENAKEYFINECLGGDETRFVGIEEKKESFRPDKPYHKVPDGWRKERICL